jgi:hypothetical protein
VSGHVVTFASERELGLVATSARFSPFWIGLRQTANLSDEYTTVDDLDEPGWSTTCAGCYAHVNPGEKITTGAKYNGNCVTGEQDDTLPAHPWHASICGAVGDASVTRETICEREPLGTRASYCGGPICFTVPATLGRKSYSLDPSALSAADAITECNSRGGRLVVYESAEEREQVASVVATETVSPVTTFWIGLASNAGAWAWDDPSGITPLPWGMGEPSLDASTARAYVTTARGAVDSDLARAGDPSEAHPFVCER